MDLLIKEVTFITRKTDSLGEGRSYWDVFIQSFGDYWRYLSQEVLNPHLHNYFLWLVGLSLLVWTAELVVPWRKNQKAIRKDFWLDGFYMLFNFFLFSLIGYHAVSNVFVQMFNDFLSLFGINNLIAISIGAQAVIVQLFVLFIVRDFVQWNVHRLLHRVPALWEFHKVHHSVKEMGFAAHLRYHWMETIVYRTLEYIPLAMIGFGIDDFFIVHIFTLLIGHINHSNIGLDYGPLRYVLNNPKMHIWHHAKSLPNDKSYGVNFGISLSLWDYIFGTSYLPENGRDIELGFEGVDNFPKTFLGQVTHGFSTSKVKTQSKEIERLEN